MIRCIVLLLLIGLFFSCKSKKVIRFDSDQTAKEALMERINDISIDYTWYSAKARIHLETSDMSGGGRMNIRMIRDSLVWFNFKKLSVEGARGLIQPDTFCIVYRLEKMYEKGDLKELFDYYQLPLTFSELQYYLAGNIPFPHEETVRYRAISGGHKLTGKNNLYQLEYSFNEGLDFTGFTLSDETGRTLNIEVKNKDEETGIYLNRKLSFPYDQENTGILDINLNNIEIDVPKQIRFSVPAHYSQY